MKHLQGNKSDYPGLAAILILALLLRIVGLDAPLWYDEILTIDTHLRLPWSDMMQGYSMNNHYLFNLQSKSMISLFGEQNWVVRLPAVLFGVGAIAAMWWLARDVAGTTIAHLTALLLAISYHHIWFSQNARGYTELAFFGTVGMILFLRGLAHPKPVIWLAYGVTLALAIFTHLTGAFLFAAQGLAWLSYVAFGSFRNSLKPGQIKLPLLGYIVGGVLTLLFYAPLLPSLLDTVGAVSGTSTIDVMQEYQNPLWSLLEGVRTAIGSTGILVGIVALTVVILAFLGAKPAHSNAPLFGPIVGVHIVLTLILLVTLGMRIWPRFFFVDIAFLMLLIVLGVRLICNWFGQLSRPMFVIASIGMIAISGVLASRNYVAPKQDLNGAFEFVEAARTPKDRVFSVGHASTVFGGYFGADWQAILTDEEYLAASALPGPMIFVVAFPARTLRKVSALDADTEDNLKLLYRFPGTLGDGAVLIFRRE